MSSPERPRTRKEHTEDADKELIVEVGAGANPYLFSVSDEYRDHFRSNQHIQYVAVDLDTTDLERTQRRIQLDTFDIGKDRVHVVNASGEQLPFRDDAVSELIFRNVLGDPDIDGWGKRWMLDEAIRVLRPGGVLKIVEQYTPDVALRPAVANHIKKIILDTPLEIVDESTLPPHELSADAKQYFLAESDEDSFVVRLRKKKAHPTGS